MESKLLFELAPMAAGLKKLCKPGWRCGAMQPRTQPASRARGGGATATHRSQLCSFVNCDNSSTRCHVRPREDAWQEQGLQFADGVVLSFLLSDLGHPGNLCRMTRSRARGI